MVWYIADIGDISVNHSGFAHGTYNCAHNISYVSEMNIDFCLRILDETVKLWHPNWRRSVGFPESLCFAMFRWMRVWTTEPPGGISYFDRHALATMRYAALHSTLKNKVQVVASASALWNIWIPPWGKYGKTRSSNIETAKHLDFSKTVMRQDNFQTQSPRALKDL